MDVIRSLADRIVVLHNGRLVADGAAARGDGFADRAGSLSGSGGGACLSRCSRSKACTPISRSITSCRASSFAVPEGGITVLLGRNGAGKTTCMRTIMGLWRASQGRIVVRRREHRRPRHADDRPARHRLCAGEHGPLHRPDGAGEPGAGGASRGRSMRRGWSGCSVCSRRSRRSGRCRPAISPAGRSRCCRWRARSSSRAGSILIDEPTKGLAPAIVKSMIAAHRRAEAHQHHDPAGGAEFRHGAGRSATRWR